MPYGEFVERICDLMLVGKYRHSLDGKNRLFIPAKHREQLGEKFVITRNVDQSLSVYSMEEWEKYTEKLSVLPKTQARTIARFIYSNASEVVPDSQGRVIITPELKEFAAIEKNAVIVGCGDYSEIWSEERWNEQNGEEEIEDVKALMMSLDF